MTIYVPLLYICMGLKCGFFQSEIYTTDEQDCEQEIAIKKAEYTAQGVKVDAICIDINLKNERKNREFDRKLFSPRTDQVRNSSALGVRQYPR